MSRVRVTRGRLKGDPGSCLGLYPRLLGVRWLELDPSVRRAHADGAVVYAAGLLRVEHGTGRLTWLVLRAAGVPPPSVAAEARLSVSRRGLVERWHRTFGGKPLVSVQRQGPGSLLAERFGILELRFRLDAIDGALIYRQAGLAIRLGPLRLPVPRWLSPRVVGRAGATGGADQTSIDVEVIAPTGALLFSYRGVVRWGEKP